MTDLVAWLRVQLDAEEREINRHPIDGFDWGDDPDGYFATAEENYPCQSLLTVGKKFALAEVDAKRKLLREAEEQGGDLAPPAWCWVPKVLALPYADRPGYLDEWRP